MMFEIINPSDPYTLVCDDFKIAAAAILLVGKGKLGLSCEEKPELEVPPMIFATKEQFDEWCKGAGIHPAESFINSHRTEIADCLDTVLIGDVGDRRLFEKIIANIKDPLERKGALEVYHDEKRSSLNDIGKAAWSYAKALREPKPEQPAAETP